MIPAKRRIRILELLRHEDMRSIQDLAAELDVSHMTIRRDVAELERAGQVLAVTGGVRLAGRMLTEPGHDEKMLAQVEQKRAMAVAVAERIGDGRAVYLDAGTSTFAVAPLLTGRSGLTVVTNDFAIAAYLMDFPEIELFHTGGRVDHANRSAVGDFAAATVAGLRLDVAVVSCSSWDALGVTTPSEAKVGVKRAAMVSSAVTVLLADSTKFGRRALHRVAGLGSFDVVVTDDGLAADDAEAVAAAGVELVVCAVGAQAAAVAGQ